MADLDAYIASSFSLKDRIWECHDALQDAGIGVPDVWWDESREQADLKVLDVPDPEWYAQEVVLQRAKRHYDAIEGCDLYVIVAPGDRTKKFNGANIELGYAYAQGCVCVCYGQLERSAMYVGPGGQPVRQCPNIESLVEVIADKFPKRVPAKPLGGEAA
jgi:hypothetical protein